MTEDGVVRTTSGDIRPVELGVTSMHEHVLLDARVWYRVRAPEYEVFRDEPVTLDRLPALRWHAYSFLENLVLEDAALAARELASFSRAGGDAVVDLTSTGLGGDPRQVAAVGERAEVRIVIGTGYYTHASHDASTCQVDVEELEERIDAEVREGVRGSQVLPGVLGEMGMSAPPQECERRALRAAARVAARYGMSVHIHVDGGGDFAPQHLEDCLSEGLAPDRVVCGHMDERLDLDYHLRLLKEGANVAFDTFGSELHFSGLFSHPSDTTRMGRVVELIEKGFASQIVLGHDVFVKAHLHAFGGNGYDHLSARVLPTLRHEYGVPEGVIAQITVLNPRQLLTCRPPIPASGPRPHEDRAGEPVGRNTGGESSG